MMSDDEARAMTARKLNRMLEARKWLDTIDGGLINYDKVIDAHGQERLPFSVRLDAVQEQRIVNTHANPAVDNPEIAAWLYEQGILCAMQESVHEINQKARDELHALLETDRFGGLVAIAKRKARLKVDHSIPSDTVLWFTDANEWIAFRMRFL